MSKRIRVIIRVVAEADDWKLDAEWSAARIYSEAELVQSNLAPGRRVEVDFCKDLRSMLDNAMAHKLEAQSA